jgi:hypothetical protein
MSDFVDRWKDSGAAERANYGMFLLELCDFLEVPRPDTTKSDLAKNAYVFERDVEFQLGDGSTSTGRIDLYKRGCFVLEAKQGSDQDREKEAAERSLDDPKAKKSAKKKGTAVRGTKAWDDAMVRARGQVTESGKTDGDVRVEVRPVKSISSLLRSEFKISDVRALQSNEGLCFQGLIPGNDGFKITRENFKELGINPQGVTVAERRLVPLSSIDVQPVEWLWPGRIAAGSVTVLQGDPGSSKRGR